jgi:peptidase E
MKRILLTSNGLTSKKLRNAFLKLLTKPTRKIKILIIHAAVSKKDLCAIERTFLRLGVRKDAIFYTDIRRKINKHYKGIDVFFACGGNTFYILYRVRHTGLDRKIKNFVKKGGLYIGLSAGSIILAPSIAIAGWGSDRDSNFVKLKDLRGLNVAATAIFPHYRRRFKKEIEAFRRRVRYPVVALRDGQALLERGTKTSFIA